MKKVLKVVGILLLYFGITYACAFIGLLGPAAWIYGTSTAIAFLAATPVLIAGAKWTKPGVFILFTGALVVLYVLAGESFQPEAWISFAVVTALAEIIRAVIGYKKQMGIRLGYAVNILGLAGSFLPLWFRPEWYYEGAVAEMGSTEYADTLMKFSNPAGLIVLVILMLVAGYLGCLVSEKIFKGKVTI